MSQLFFRDGSEVVGAIYCKGDKPFTQKAISCFRCGGAGQSDRWAYTGYTCYRCGGSKYEPQPREFPLYTREQLTKLDATRAKRRSTKAAAAEVKRLEIQAQADALREAFEAQHVDLLGWLADAGVNEEGAPKEGFLGDMLRQARLKAMWTERQVEGLEKCRRVALERQVERAASTWFGDIGDRITADVTVTQVRNFSRERFHGGYGADRRETVWVITMRDDAGHSFISKSPNFYHPEGWRLQIKGTVKRHSEYKDLKQTELNRIKLIAATEPEALQEAA